MSQAKISVAIITKDGEKTLKNCLDKLVSFDEVVVLLDSKTTDRSREVVEAYPNVVVYPYVFDGFGKAKNEVCSRAKNNWILSVDSDEVLTNELITEIHALDLSDIKLGYKVSRLNHYRGRAIKACGWSPDYVTRLFNKEATQFSNDYVHEYVMVDGLTILKLEGQLLHYPFEGVEGLINKMQYYSSLYAKDESRRGGTFLKPVSRGIFSFFKSYIIKKGFLYGYDGFIISFCNGLGTFFKYIKVYEKK